MNKANDKVLVAYFSAEGHTAKIAKDLAEVTGADLFEIQPVEPYTAADINWKNPMARCNREQFAKREVVLAGEVENFGDYKVVFLGFPIWYFAAPKIIEVFVKAHDWTGKRVMLFATSGGSDIEKEEEKLKPLFGGKGEVDAAKRFFIRTEPETLAEWANPLIMPWKAKSQAHEPGRPDMMDVVEEYRDQFNRIRTMDEDFTARRP